MPPKIEYKQWVIDVAKSLEPGMFCFYPVSETEEGGLGVVPKLPFMAPTPPDPQAQVIGFIFEGPTDELDAWTELNKPFLERLNIVAPV